MLFRAVKNNQHGVCSCAERRCENKWNKNVDTGNNDEDCQESDAEADDEKTIDMIDQIMFKNCTCSEVVFFQYISKLYLWDKNVPFNTSNL